ncbi:MAG: Fe-S cluster assembly protein SufD [Gammaproteobacteria bacterium]
MSAESPLVSALPRPAADGFAGVRTRARKRFVELGLPTRGNEAYKFTDLASLGAEAWPRARPGAVAAALPPALGRRVVWSDGVLGENSTSGLVSSLADLADAPPPALVELLGSLAREDDSIAALNTALFDHGVWIDVPENEHPAEALELVFATSTRDSPGATHARIVLRLGAGSRLTLIERHLGGGETRSLSTRVSEIVLETGAELTHLRLNEAAGNTTLLGNTAVRVGEGARYRYLTLDLGAKLARETLDITLAGNDGHTELAGLALLDGRRHSDQHVTVEHLGLRTRSRQNFRGVLDGRSRGIYSGLVRVQPGAQKSDSGQESANLLLSRHAEADVRPQLEIYADDVVCTHGAATGTIDPDALFYLQSRGVGADAARRMIAYGFAARTLNMLEDAKLHRALAGLLADRLDAPTEVREWL